MNFLPIASTAAGLDVHPSWIIPFALLLLLIATMPLTPHAVKHFWEKFYPAISIALGTIVGVYYWLNGGTPEVMAALHEYVSFIVLIGSLFVVAGGIQIDVPVGSRPLSNTLFLLFGSVLANFIGTTGASMVLIRPWIRMNKHRIQPLHVVFFIFTISNVGGMLTPIGDPPLFLGYLRGVPFFWLIDHVILEWLFVLGSLLVVFFILDTIQHRKAPPLEKTSIAAHGSFAVRGLVNLPLLALVVGAVFLPETFFLRQIAMLAIAAISLRLTPKSVHAANEFTFAPIKEVGFLFIGIFLTMMPALGYLKKHGSEFGIDRPIEYYLSTGALSGVLDNAPTYLNFLVLAQSSVPPAEALIQAETNPTTDATSRDRAALHWLLDEKNHTKDGTHAPLFIVAISLAAVFFGAMTYIGNGPNFMVKSIAEAAQIETPSFFGYVFKYSLPILLPILLACGWIFF